MALSLAPTAHAAYTHRDALENARSVIGESGWGAYQRGEDLAIVGVHLHRMSLPANRGRSLAAVTRAYSSALNGNRPWVIRLGHGWPRSLPRRYMPAWDATLASVEDFLRHGHGNRCQEAEHYGSRADGPPGPGYIRVCRFPGWKSHFWRRYRSPRIIRPVSLGRRG